jgi:hypothetical protein
MQILCIIIIIIIFTAEILKISEAKSQFNYFLSVLVSMSYCLTEHVDFTVEHQLFTFMHLLKHTVQNWNKHIDVVYENDDEFNGRLCRNVINRRKSLLFIVSRNPVTSKCENIYNTRNIFFSLKTFTTCTFILCIFIYIFFLFISSPLSIMVCEPEQIT